VARNKEERALEKAIRDLIRVTEAAARQAKQPGAPGQTGLNQAVSAGPGPTTFGGGFKGAGGLASGLAGSKANITARGLGGVAGQLAGRTLGGLAARAGSAALGAAQDVASAGLTAASRGQDISASIALSVDKRIQNVPFLGEGARKRVATTEGVISDLNALTNDLDALGFDTSNIAAKGAEIFKAQQERVFDAQKRNVDIGRQAVEPETLFGQVARSFHGMFSDAGLNGAR